MFCKDRKGKRKKRGLDGRGALLFLEGSFFALAGERFLNEVEIFGN